MKRLVICVLAFSIMLGVLVVSKRNTPDVQQPGVPSPPVVPIDPIRPSLTIQEALNVVDKQELKQILYWLASPELEGRMSAKKGNDAARDYLLKYYQSLGFETTLQTFTVNNINNFKEAGTGKTSNVIATIPGNDPLLKNEVIIIGAHYDHIGYGPAMSRAPSRREVHPGADDNASGTTALLGAAKVLSQMKGKNKRRIVLISFSAEEMGLIGAKYYVNNPAYPGTVFMLNMDMVGRLKGGSIDAMGAGSSPQVKGVLQKISGYPFKPNITNSSGGGSDHAPFYQKSIPVCFLHTGMHGDYHTPDDTPDKINYDGLAWVAKYAAHIVWEVDQLPSRPTFSGVVGVETKFLDHEWK
jgi:Zn-dependent M28 family amino/carboxypeptidase